MAKGAALIPFIFILLTSCNDGKTFTIEGKVPNAAFDGSRVFLVSLDAPVTKNVDSTIVENSSFSFQIKADSFSVKILRIPAKFPNVAEDLVVIPEPGMISVILDSISSGQGTRLNNILQQWKERKRYHESVQWKLYNLKNSAGINPATADSLENVLQKTEEIFLSDLICMINENLFNGIGLLIYKVYFDALPSSEKNYITQMTGKKYLDKDAQLRARFY